jgi:hypothetical protein
VVLNRDTAVLTVCSSKSMERKADVTCGFRESGPGIEGNPAAEWPWPDTGKWTLLPHNLHTIIPSFFCPSSPGTNCSPSG